MTLYNPSTGEVANFTDYVSLSNQTFTNLNISGEEQCDFFVRIWGGGGAGAECNSIKKTGGYGGYSEGIFTLYDNSTYGISVGEGGTSTTKPCDGGGGGGGSAFTLSSGEKEIPYLVAGGGSGASTSKYGWGLGWGGLSGVGVGGVGSGSSGNQICARVGGQGKVDGFSGDRSNGGDEGGNGSCKSRAQGYGNGGCGGVAGNNLGGGGGGGGGYFGGRGGAANLDGSSPGGGGSGFGGKTVVLNPRDGGGFAGEPGVGLESGGEGRVIIEIAVHCCFYSSVNHDSSTCLCEPTCPVIEGFTLTSNTPQSSCDLCDCSTK